MMPPRLMIAGTHSGAGKTTVSSAILAGLTARGLRIQPFKAGPDYIDPTHLSRAAQLECRNLDPYMLPPGTLERLFVRAASRSDFSLIEGVMGLYDGKDATSDAFSSADLARRLATPVVLVLDASGAGRSVAAMALGFREFASDLHVAGVILNRVGSPGHARLCEAALEGIGVRSFGFLERHGELELPERHLGLILAGETRWDAAAFVRAAQTLDLDGLLKLARSAPPLVLPTDLLPLSRQPVRARIAIARDAAFNFYYADALETLELLGAELVPFSPLEDAAVPDAEGLLIGGGYPELHAARLAANAAMLESVRAFCAGGKPVVAECGGLMYLARSLTDLSGQTHALCGAIPARTKMLAQPVLGYREVIALEDSPVALAGARLRGHEFHFSTLETPVQARPAYRQAEGEMREGFVIGNLLASYLHLHFAADASLAERFVAQAAQFAGVNPLEPRDWLRP